MLATLTDPGKPEPGDKRRRGRPRIMELPDNLAGMIGLPEVDPRQRANHFYSWKATALLGDYERFAWLFNGPGGKPRTGVLAELGRIEDPARQVAAAFKVCDRKMKAKEAEAWIRRIRRGQATEATVEGLAARIAETINAYSASHPGVTAEMVKDAMERVTLS